MQSNVPVAEATVDEMVLPDRVQDALGDLVGAAREGLLALSVSVGLGVLSELLEEEVTELVGPKGRWNRDRSAVRHGHEDGGVTLGGRRVVVRRPRVRTADGESELPLVSYQHFADRDPLGRVVLERVLAGVSTRKYRRAQDPVGAQAAVRERSTSKSSVSRAFVERTREALWQLMSRQLADLRLAVVMLDGIEIKGRMNVVALGITTDGEKLALGLWAGTTENATVAGALLSDLSPAGWTSSRECCSRSMAPRRCARRSARCSATRSPSSAASGIRSATCSSISPRPTAAQSSGGRACACTPTSVRQAGGLNVTVPRSRSGTVDTSAARSSGIRPNRESPSGRLRRRAACAPPGSSSEDYHVQESKLLAAQHVFRSRSRFRFDRSGGQAAVRVPARRDAIIPVSHRRRRRQVETRVPPLQLPRLWAAAQAG